MADEQDATVFMAVIGDEGVGKSSLIAAATTDTFPDHPPPVLPPARLPAETTPAGAPVVITDTSSRPEDRPKLEASIAGASVLVLCFAVDDDESLRRLSTHWLPELRRLGSRVPVILVGCKGDSRPGVDASLQRSVLPVLKAYPVVETCLLTSARRLQYVGEAFYYAMRAVLHPTAPLYDQEALELRPRAARALKRVFLLHDRDGDGALSDAELNAFQVRCFGAPLQPDELASVKALVAGSCKGGISPRGLTLAGFLFLNRVFVERGRIETTWAVLRAHGYAKDLRLDPALLPAEPYPGAGPDAVVELTPEGRELFLRAFDRADRQGNGALTPGEYEELFSTAPEKPWRDPADDDASDADVGTGAAAGPGPAAGQGAAAQGLSGAGAGAGKGAAAASVAGAAPFAASAGKGSAAAAGKASPSPLPSARGKGAGRGVGRGGASGGANASSASAATGGGASSSLSETPTGLGASSTSPTAFATAAAAAAAAAATLASAASAASAAPPPPPPPPFVERTRRGHLTRSGYEALWAATAAEDPRLALEYAVYLGWPDASSAAARLAAPSRPRRAERRGPAGAPKRRLVRGGIFAPPGLDPTPLLEGLVAAARPSHAPATSPIASACAVVPPPYSLSGADWLDDDDDDDDEDDAIRGTGSGSRPRSRGGAGSAGDGDTDGWVSVGKGKGKGGAKNNKSKKQRHRATAGGKSNQGKGGNGSGNAAGGRESGKESGEPGSRRSAAGSADKPAAAAAAAAAASSSSSSSPSSSSALDASSGASPEPEPELPVTLLLRAYSDAQATVLLARPDARRELAKLDVAAFPYAAGDEASLDAARRLALAVASAAGDELSCVLVATGPEARRSEAVARGAAAAAAIGLRAPTVPGPQGAPDLYRVLVAAAKDPEPLAPDTETLRARRRRAALLRRAAWAALAGGALAAAGYLLFRTHEKAADRKNADAQPAAKAIPDAALAQANGPTQA